MNSSKSSPRPTTEVQTGLNDLLFESHTAAMFIIDPQTGAIQLISL